MENKDERYADLVRRILTIEARLKKIEEISVAQAKLLKEQNVYIVHLRKKNKKTI